MSVTPADIAVALGEDAPSPDSAEWAQWSMFIADAEMLIETRRLQVNPDLVLDEMKFDYVVRSAVVSHVQHPDGATQVTVSVDDASTSRSYKSGRGRVGILDEWWALLGLTGDSGAAFAVDTYAGPDRRHGHSDICNIFFGSPTCSCGAYLVLGKYPYYETGWLG